MSRTLSQRTSFSEQGDTFSCTQVNTRQHKTSEKYIKSFELGLSPSEIKVNARKLTVRPGNDKKCPMHNFPKFRATANTWMASELSAGAAVRCSARFEILHRSVINGTGRAPLIVVPDTGTRPQTKQDRAGAGCHAQSPSNRKPQRCSQGRVGTEGWLEEREVIWYDSRGEDLSKRRKPGADSIQGAAV